MLSYEEAEELERLLKQSDTHNTISLEQEQEHYEIAVPNVEIETAGHNLKLEASKAMKSAKSTEKPATIMACVDIVQAIERLELCRARVAVDVGEFKVLTDMQELAAFDRYNAAHYEQAAANSGRYIGFTDFERPQRYFEIGERFDLPSSIFPARRSKLGAVYQADIDLLGVEYKVFKRRIYRLLRQMEGYAYCSVSQALFFQTYFSNLICPFCFLFDDDVKLIKTFWGVYKCVLWRLEDFESLCRLILVAEEIIRVSNPEILHFLQGRQLSIESIVVPWFLSGLVGILPLREVFYLWDNAILNEKADYFAVAAAALIIFKYSTFRCFDDKEDIIVYINENQGIELFVVIKDALKDPGVNH